MPQSFFGVIFHFLKQKSKGFWGMLMLAIYFGIAPSIDSIILKFLLDAVENSQELSSEAFLKMILFWAVIYGLWWESTNWLWRLYDYIYMKTIPEIRAIVIRDYFLHTMNHSHKFFQNNLAGFITNKIVDASRSFDLIFSEFNENLLRKIVTLISALITLYFVKPIFATILLIWLLFFFGFSAIFADRIKNLSIKWSRNRSMISGKVVDAISNIASVRIYNNSRYEEKYLDKSLNKMRVSEEDLNWFMLKLRYVLGVSTSTMIVFMVYYLGYLKTLGEVTIGDFALVISLCITMSDDIWEFSQELGDFFEEVGGFMQAFDLLEQPEIKDIPNASSLLVDNGKIEFKNVTFKYKRNNNIFNNKSITIKPNEKVGLVGFSGSGKTTFINLIVRLYDIAEGEILIDNQNIHEVTQQSLRDNICMLPQEPILFNRTIYENIQYGNINASFEDVIDATKKVGIYSEIMELEDGFETLCGEKGSNLSGGQRQRIAIARAILKNAPILILDEATSALDTITEKEIQTSLEYLMKDKTVLVIAHRLSTLQNMDRLLVFNKGHIVEDGDHKTLQKNNKLYNQLWKSQVGGFIAEHPDIHK